MRTDDQFPTDDLDAHCWVHHFIRTHGRRPTDQELQALRDSAAGPPMPRPRRAAVSETLPGAVRRELARLIQRL